VVAFSHYLRDTIANSKAARNFRVMCPDELDSNRLSAVLEVTDRAYVWPVKSTDEHLAPDGLVMEILSEHTCQGWLEGYLLTGRHGLFPCYEAFVAIVDSMVNQYAKFLKQAQETPWRKPISSLNYLLTSTGWRQDHNGYSHQTPGFINQLITKKASMVRIYLPPDANCLIQTMDHVLWSTNYINLVIASKQPELQWLTKDQALEHCRRGASIWRWASPDGYQNPDVVLACAGDLITLETMAAVWLLHREVPELQVRVVNVTDLMVLDQQSEHPHGFSDEDFKALFTPDRPVIFSFHGYPQAIQSLLFGRPNLVRFQINGYHEEGSTTSPLDMMIRNNISRYQIVMQAVQASSRLPAEKVTAIVQKYAAKLVEHRRYIDQYQDDPPETKDWKWSNG
jgi:xylulose-5-phosphate/fructose-6-phosphate phosphoketolase